jgi:hypothetical protein
VARKSDFACKNGAAGAAVEPAQDEGEDESRTSPTAAANRSQLGFPHT